MNLLFKLAVALMTSVVLALPASAVTYAVYYDCTADRETALVISDVSGVQNLGAVTIAAFDRDGGRIAERSIDLSTYGSEVIFLSDWVEAAGNNAWGLVTVECEALLQVATWIGDTDGWIAVNHVIRPFLSGEDPGYAYYWQGIGYANTSSRKTGLLLINGTDRTVSGDVRFFDSAGTLLDVLEFELPSHASAYQPSEYLLEEAPQAWGLIDVRANAPIVLAAEFFDEAGALIDIDQETVYYYAR